MPAWLLIYKKMVSFLARVGSVCLFVTVVNHAETVQDIETHFLPHDRAMFLDS